MKPEPLRATAANTPQQPGFAGCGPGSATSGSACSGPYNMRPGGEE
jgi:hypothetical protein